MDITNIIDNLVLDSGVDLNSLDVRVMPNQSAADAADITLDQHLSPTESVNERAKNLVTV